MEQTEEQDLVDRACGDSLRRFRRCALRSIVLVAGVVLVLVLVLIVVLLEAGVLPCKALRRSHLVLGQRWHARLPLPPSPAALWRVAVLVRLFDVVVIRPVLLAAFRLGRLRVCLSVCPQRDLHRADKVAVSARRPRLPPRTPRPRTRPSPPLPPRPRALHVLLAAIALGAIAVLFAVALVAVGVVRAIGVVRVRVRLLPPPPFPRPPATVLVVIGPGGHRAARVYRRGGRHGWGCRSSRGGERGGVALLLDARGEDVGGIGRVVRLFHVC